jgi:cation diffusion facilitator family transporter
VRRVLAHVLVLNFAVLAVKLIIGVRTGALTVLGAALESGLDTLNNVIGMLLVSVAGREPDEDHPYGHDKFETLGALGIVGFLSISCFELLREGIASLVTGGGPHEAGNTDIALLVGTLAINAFVVWYERRRARQLRSAFLLADAAHTGSDILVTLLALASLALSRIGWGHADGALAITIALIIAWSGYRILRESIPILVDERAVNADELKAIVAEIPEIAEVRHVRSRFTASGTLFADVTISVVGTTTVEDAHILSDAVEAVVGRRYGAAEVTVHVEPA